MLYLIPTKVILSQKLETWLHDIIHLLENVTISETVKIIRQSAFANSDLTEVPFLDSIEVMMRVHLIFVLN